MATRHKWDKSSTTAWPLVCLACGVTGRVKMGTCGTMEYLYPGGTVWVKRAPCEPQKKEEA